MILRTKRHSGTNSPQSVDTMRAAKTVMAILMVVALHRRNILKVSAAQIAQAINQGSDG